jgi:hypothetical protein
MSFIGLSRRAPKGKNFLAADGRDSNYREDLVDRTGCDELRSELTDDLKKESGLEKGSAMAFLRVVKVAKEETCFVKLNKRTEESMNPLSHEEGILNTTIARA